MTGTGEKCVDGRSRFSIGSPGSAGYLLILSRSNETVTKLKIVHFGASNRIVYSSFTGSADDVIHATVSGGASQSGVVFFTAKSLDWAGWMLEGACRAIMLKCEPDVNPAIRRVG